MQQTANDTALAHALQRMRTAAGELADQFSDRNIPSITCYADGVIVVCDPEGHALTFTFEPEGDTQ